MHGMWSIAACSAIVMPARPTAAAARRHAGVPGSAPPAARAGRLVARARVGRGSCGCRPNRVGLSVEPRNASDRVIWGDAPWIVFWRFQMLVLGPSVELQLYEVFQMHLMNASSEGE